MFQNKSNANHKSKMTAKPLFSNNQFSGRESDEAFRTFYQSIIYKNTSEQFTHMKNIYKSNALWAKKSFHALFQQLLSEKFSQHYLNEQLDLMAAFFTGLNREMKSDTVYVKDLQRFLERTLTKMDLAGHNEVISKIENILTSAINNKSSNHKETYLFIAEVAENASVRLKNVCKPLLGLSVKKNSSDISDMLQVDTESASDTANNELNQNEIVSSQRKRERDSGQNHLESLSLPPLTPWTSTELQNFYDTMPIIKPDVNNYFSAIRFHRRSNVSLAKYSDDIKYQRTRSHHHLSQPSEESLIITKNKIENGFHNSPVVPGILIEQFFSSAMPTVAKITQAHENSDALEASAAVLKN